MKYELGQNDFRTICDNISAFAMERRVTTNRGRRDMQVDSLIPQADAQKYTTEG